MTEEKKKAIVVELKVSMHCKACERSVFNTLSKFKGVETVKTDMNGHKAIITGQMEPQKVIKKLKKKTGKRAEIVAKKGDNAGGNGDGSDPAATAGDCTKYGLDRSLFVMDELDEGLVLNFDMFSDENPNACSIM